MSNYIKITVIILFIFQFFVSEAYSQTSKSKDEGSCSLVTLEIKACKESIGNMSNVDNRCIQLLTSGGEEPYEVRVYDLINEKNIAVSVSPELQIMSLPKGEYLIRLKDKKGCRVLSEIKIE